MRMVWDEYTRQTCGSSTSVAACDWVHVAWTPLGELKVCRYCGAQYLFAYDRR
jgi:hypothetical protein